MARVIAAEQGSSFTPAATRDEGPLIAILHDKVGSVSNKLRIDAKHGPERTLQLYRRVITCLEGAHGTLDQPADSGYVRCACSAQFKRRSNSQAKRLRPA